MTTEQAVAAVDAALPRLVKDALQRAGFQLEAFVEGFIDESGGPPYPRSSPRWGAVTGRAVRSLVPGAADNIYRFQQQGPRFSVVYGSKVPYLRFLEEGTRHMKPRPALTPGFKAFEREGMTKLLEGIMVEIASVFNGR